MELSGHVSSSHRMDLGGHVSSNLRMELCVHVSSDHAGGLSATRPNYRSNHAPESSWNPNHNLAGIAVAALRCAAHSSTVIRRRTYIYGIMHPCPAYHNAQSSLMPTPSYMQMIALSQILPQSPRLSLFINLRVHLRLSMSLGLSLRQMNPKPNPTPEPKPRLSAQQAQA